MKHELGLNKGPCLFHIDPCIAGTVVTSWSVKARSHDAIYIYIYIYILLYPDSEPIQNV